MEPQDMPRNRGFADPSFRRDYVDQLYDMHAFREDNRERALAMRGEGRTGYGPPRGGLPPAQGARPIWRMTLPPEPPRPSRTAPSALNPAHGMAPRGWENMKRASVLRHESKWQERTAFYARRYTRQAAELARRGAAFAKRASYMGRAAGHLWDLFNYLEAGDNNAYTGRPRPTPRGLWHEYIHCGAFPLDSMHFYASSLGDGHSSNCLAGQAGEGYPLTKANVEEGTGPANASRTRTMVFGPKGSGNHQNSQWWHWHGAGLPTIGLGFSPGAIGIPQPNRMPNPNLVRRLPRTWEPIPQATYGESPAPYGRDRPGWRRDLSRALGVSPGTWTVTVPGGRGRGPGSRPPVTKGPIGRKPEVPTDRTKERKKMTRSLRFATKLFKLLDNVSEGSEIVGAFYEALPEKIREDNPCNARRGPVDNFGQYGIDNADCKIGVLYRHWDQVDFDAALWNVLKNEWEDRIYGQLHRNLPKQFGGPAGQEPMERFSEIMTSLGF